ncbi:MAG: cadmium-translocating P-type ATPase [Lachnospiraceae bacterium]|nr:cadmium-translocating P-type ATPase [Lachnospiraceae bacterium]MBP3578173.1 cadmium-translocating P-type ATPase [Lachnospiraceae bacterium]
MTKKQKKLLKKILLAVAVFAVACLISFLLPDFPGKQWVSLAVFLAAYFLAGGDIVRKALLGIKNGQVFDENFLMALATVGAFFVGEYPEGVMVMILFQIGELFQAYAVGKSRKSISSLMQIRPDYANLIENGETREISPEKVSVGDYILVKPGEKVPLDGIITEGNSSLDTAALTGESLPREVSAGDTAISGCINLRGTLTVQVTKTSSESTVSKILDMVENASARKAQAENFISRFARYYTPVVVILAVILAFVPPIILGGGFSDWIYRALNFLVVSCPCALVISVPLGFFGGIGGAAKQGILMKGSNYLEALAKTDAFVFDKTGTLTKGNFKVTKLAPVDISETDLLKYTALAESQSSHPIAISIVEEYKAACTLLSETGSFSDVSDVEELAGFGVRAIAEEKEILAGNLRLMKEKNISLPADITEFTTGTAVYVAVDGTFAGTICVEDEIKPDTVSALETLRNSGIRKLVMLTGDKKATGEAIAKKLGLSDVHTELLPADKVTHLEELLTLQPSGHTLAYVGDGINDAPVLARADIGIAMGGLGSDAAIEAADIVIMTDEPSKLPTAIRIARGTMRIVRQNIVFALGVKVLVLLLSALGYSNMWMAIFADVGVCVLAILNSMRALRLR